MTHDQTKSRLLDAAGEEFAAKGFDGATIRSIAGAAGTNVASANYHFGDKQHLYTAAVVEAHACTHRQIDWAELNEGNPEDRLRTFVRHFLSSVMEAEGRRTWHGRLMLREMLDPSEASDCLVRDAIRPQFEWLVETIRLLTPGAEERRLNALAFSVVGQCLHYKAGRTISTRLIGAEAYARLDLDFLTDHITDFCLAGIGHAPTPPEMAASGGGKRG